MTARITDIIITPIAFRDPPLLNSWGVHEPLALRTIVQVVVDDTIVGWGEGSGEASVLADLRAVRAAVIGADPFDLNGIERTVHTVLAATRPAKRDRLSAFAILEVACLDAQGRLAGVSVASLLGGAVRDRVPYSGYLFYKWAGHPDAADDEWGAATSADGIVAQARRMIDKFGFGSLKLKAGVFPPDIEIATIRALAEEFPGLPLRIDPNGAWSVPTAMHVARELGDVLEYLEDPTLGVDGMAAVAAEAGLPLATNMCVVSFETIPPALAVGAVSIVLGDHHFWGGLRRTRELARICETLSWGLSMHSNSHLGISLAAMTHLAAATENLTYACDTHYPWNAADDIVVPGTFTFVDGSLGVPAGPGLGVEVAAERLAALHDVYVASGRTVRDDTAYMRRVDPGYDPSLPRF